MDWGKATPPPLPCYTPSSMVCNSRPSVSQDTSAVETSKENASGAQSPSARGAGRSARGTSVPRARGRARGRGRGRGTSKGGSLSQPPPDLPRLDASEEEDMVLPRASKVFCT